LFSFSASGKRGLPVSIMDRRNKTLIQHRKPVRVSLMKKRTDTLADRVAYLHAVSGLDRLTMSTLAELSPGHVGMLIRSEVTRPASETLAKIARTYNASLEWLSTGDGPRPTEVNVRNAATLAALKAVKSAQKGRP
jgi:hypothetical protein